MPQKMKMMLSSQKQKSLSGHMLGGFFPLYVSQVTQTDHKIDHYSHNGDEFEMMEERVG